MWWVDPAFISPTSHPYMEELKLEGPWFRQFQGRGSVSLSLLGRTFQSSKLIHMIVFIDYLGHKIYVRHHRGSKLSLVLTIKKCIVTLTSSVYKILSRSKGWKGLERMGSLDAPHWIRFKHPGYRAVKHGCGKSQGQMTPLLGSRFRSKP